MARPQTTAYLLLVIAYLLLQLGYLFGNVGHVEWRIVRSVNE
jgi:hypothetical protein